MGSSIGYRPNKYDAFVTIAQDGTGDFNGTTEVAINNAISSISSTGGIIFIKKGTYNISNPIKIFSNVVIQGEGKSTILFLPNTINKNIIETNAVSLSYFEIKNLSINGNKANQTSASTINGIYLEEASNFLISETYISNSAYDGIRLNNCNNFKISNISSDENTNTGIQCYLGCEDGLIDNCKIISNGYAGIRLNESNKCCISNVNAINNADDGIKIDGASGSTLNIVSNCYLDNNDDGIHIRQASNHCVLSNNIMRNNNKSGILAQDCEGLIISNNQCIGNTLNGIGVGGCTEFSITGNLCKNNNQENLGNDYSGINITGTTVDSEKGVITGNRCYDSQATKTQQYGILSDNSDYLCIVGNMLRNNAVAGLSFTGTNNEIGHNMEN